MAAQSIKFRYSKEWYTSKDLTITNIQTNTDS